MSEYTRDNLKDSLSEKEVSYWSLESFHDAVNFAYAGIKEGERPSDEYLQ